MVEACRRYTHFHTGEPILEAWTGLGTATDYNVIQSEGFMTVATKLNPGHDIWWKLTPAGAKIVLAWIEAGYDFEKIEKGIMPSWPKKPSKIG